MIEDVRVELTTERQFGDAIVLKLDENRVIYSARKLK